MKNSIDNPNPNVRVLIPFFCYCCVEGSNEVSDNALDQFNEKLQKNMINTDVIKILFGEIEEQIKDPKEFWSLIKSVFHEIEMACPKSLSKMIINSIKRLISLTAMNLSPELESQKCMITTNLIIQDMNTYNQFIRNLYQEIEDSKKLVWVLYTKRKHKAFSLFKENDGEYIQQTEVMISQIDDYWNSTSFNNL
jgi:hypothetical protein